MKKLILIFLFLNLNCLSFADNLKPLVIEYRNKGGVEFLSEPVLNTGKFIDNSKCKKIKKLINLEIDKSFNSKIFENLKIRDFPDGKAIISLAVENKMCGIFKIAMNSNQKGYLIIFNAKNRMIFKEIKPNFDFAYPFITNLIFPEKSFTSLLIFDKLHTFELKNNELVHINTSLLTLPNIRYPNYKLFFKKGNLIVFNVTFSKYKNKVPLLFIYKFLNNSYVLNKLVYFEDSLTKKIAADLWDINNNKKDLSTIERNELISKSEDNFFIEGNNESDFYFYNQTNNLFLKGNWKTKDLTHTTFKKLSYLSIMKMLFNQFENNIWILLKPIKGKQEIVVLDESLKYQKTLVFKNNQNTKNIYIHKIQPIEKNNYFLGVYEKINNKEGKYKIIKVKEVTN